MKSRWDTHIGMYPISPEQHIVASLDVHHEKVIVTILLPTISSLQIIPLASIGSPAKLLRLRFVRLRSPSMWPSFLNNDNDKMLTLAPPSTSMCLTGVPSRCPRMNRGFMCAPGLFGFSNTTCFSLQSNNGYLKQLRTEKTSKTKNKIMRKKKCIDWLFACYPLAHSPWVYIHNSTPIPLQLFKLTSISLQLDFLITKTLYC
jgi:hypothetical protein